MLTIELDKRAHIGERESVLLGATCPDPVAEIVGGQITIQHIHTYAVASARWEKTSRCAEAIA